MNDNLRERIAALSRSAVRRPPSPLQSVPETDVEDASRSLPPSSVAGHPFAGPDDVRLRRRIEEVSDAGHPVENEVGTFFLIDRTADALLPKHGRGILRRYVDLLNRLTGETVPNDPFQTFGCLRDVGAPGVLIVDIEATGFTAGTPLFLVGALYAEGDRVVLDQLLARDYTEECALLRHFGQMLSRADVVVTFNGKTYDIPYIRDRMVFHGLAFDERHAHIDMLHEGRRRFRRRLPNCKLQTLERAICKRGRVGDIPGAEIPDAYHAFVRTGNAIAMADVLQHNALDLITLAEVMVFMLEGGEL